MAARLALVHASRGLFEGLQPDASWAFGHLSQAQTSYATHGYHRYPAKFIPQLAAKPVSYWSDRSVKPTRKLTKTVPDALAVFFRHVKRMLRGNREFWRLLHEQDALDVPAVPHCADARCLPLEDGAAQLVVTSPPYVTSYEYADLHQLSALWFNAITSLREFRERFIGRSNGIEEVNGETGSPLARQTVDKLSELNPRKAREVALYFAEMHQCFVEIGRILRRGGRVCIVIGNTHLHGVEIQNAQVFAEQLAELGFELENVILREIPSKILPRTRDKETGKFAKTAEANYIAYPTEYIIVLRKW